jgi:hypothetical protein
MPEMLTSYAWGNGQIGVKPDFPFGSFPIASAPKHRLMPALEALADRDDDGRLMVPGMAQAAMAYDTLFALAEFKARVVLHIKGIAPEINHTANTCKKGGRHEIAKNVSAPHVE